MIANCLSNVIAEAMSNDPELFDDLGCIDLLTDLAEQYGVETSDVIAIVRELESTNSPENGQ